MSSDDELSTSPPDDELSTSPPVENKQVDELTMKLLSNRNNYAKYLAMTDERKHEAHQEFIKDCITYKTNILAMTSNMCKGRVNEYGSEVGDAFDTYAQTLIRYLEVKQRSDDAQKEYDQEDDDDVMFPSDMNVVRVNAPYKTTLDYFARK